MNVFLVVLFSSPVRSNVFWFLRVCLAHCSTLFVISSTMLGLLCCIRVINDGNGVQQFVFRSAMYFPTQIALRLLPLARTTFSVRPNRRCWVYAAESNRMKTSDVCFVNRTQSVDATRLYHWFTTQRDATRNSNGFFFVFTSISDTVRVKYKNSF